MIIGENKVFPAAEFANRLKRALQGVLRVSVELQGKDTEAVNTTNSFATGWLITDTLVVICDYIVVRNTKGRGVKYFCDGRRRKSLTWPIEAEVVGKLSDNLVGERPALLRLHQPLPNRALTLRSKSLREDDELLLLHHVQGDRTASLSIGRLLSKDDHWLRYDASTLPGSGGGPIFKPYDFAVCGMHARKSSVTNEGLSLASMLEVLQEFEEWPEIAVFHNLIDVSRARRSIEQQKSTEPSPDKALLSAAVRWSFKPGSFSEEELEQIKPYVNSSTAKVWTIRASDRQDLLRSAGSLEKLREARGKNEAQDAGQKVIDRILQGPPYSLDEVDEGDLPYWLQAVRWFADVVPGLPTTAQVNRDLERRRIKARLRAIAGADFRGREEQLATLKAWYQNPQAGPMVVTGIGGVGKSALTARFIQLLPIEPILLWLDFDRADLAPDDAVSVLSILSQQLSVQLTNFSISPVTETSWQESAKAIGAALPATPAPVLVLDGFEVAQQVKQHNEIWQVLKLILEMAPGLRIVVSGRAPVEDLDLDGRPKEQIHLKGMAPEDARNWLRDRGITDEQAQQRILKISDGVPLVLLLAARLLETGGKLTDLPEELPQVMIKGFLYERILDRVIDPMLKPVAQDALVLRRVTEAMIQEVLSDRIPQGLDAAKVFERLSLELGLVGDEGDPRALSVLLPGKTDTLYLRPELRTATLKLLERDNRDRVKTIDQRAIEWYTKQDLKVLANAAEFVYHNLRLGNIEAAEQAWIEGCSLLLMYANEDLPEDATEALQWLRERVVEPAKPSQLVWEKEAAERIKLAVGRGLVRTVPEILKEIRERSKNSPLALYDAWLCLEDNDPAGARDRLGVITEITEPGDKERGIISALAAARSGDRDEADRLLQLIERQLRQPDEVESSLETLAVTAARMRLTVNLQAELALSKTLKPDSAGLFVDLHNLTSHDVVLPQLMKLLWGPWGLESSSIPVPSSQVQLDALKTIYLETRESITPRNSPTQDADSSIQNLAVLARRRWNMATESLFIWNACALALVETEQDPILSLAVVGTLAIFHGFPMSFVSPSEYFQNLDDLLFRYGQKGRKIFTPHPLASDQIRAALTVIQDASGAISTTIEPMVEKRFLVSGEVQGVDLTTHATQFGVTVTATILPGVGVQIIASGKESKVDALRRALEADSFSRIKKLEETTLTREYYPQDVMSSIRQPESFSVLLFLLGPDPLEMLARRVIGLPDNVT